MTHRGSCHCGRVRFTCEFDLAAGRVRRDGAMGTKGDLLLVAVPPGAVEMLSDEIALRTYAFGDGIRHHFCTVCGVRPFAETGAAPGQGIAVNLACLDDITADDWASVFIPLIPASAAAYL